MSHKSAADRKVYQAAWYQRNRDTALARAAARRQQPGFAEQRREYDANRRPRPPRDGRRVRMLRAYGITVAQYDAMLSLQGGTCAICLNPPKTKRLAVEHDHGPSKRVRGLACFRCNKYRIGMNTIETAKRVLAYLESDFDGRNL